MKLPTAHTFEAWLRLYGRAWETRDPAAAVELFAPDALYHWTPFGPPKRGRAEIATAWEQATARQRDVHFRFRVWFVEGRRGVAHWHTTLTRATTGLPVELDGVLAAEFDDAGRCAVFREWWHSSETA